MARKAAVIRKREGKPQNSRVRKIFNEYGIFLIFVLLIIVLSIARPNFLRPQNIMNVLRQISINGLLSIGMTFVILTGGIDLSVGSMLAFGGVIAASLASDAMGGTITHPMVAAGAALLAGLVLGSMNGALVAKFRLPSFCGNSWHAEYGPRIYFYLHRWYAHSTNR